MFILFPKGKVSEVQRKQMTTFGKDNVINVEVDGNFDDCQKLVKDFFKLNIKKEIQFGSSKFDKLGKNSWTNSLLFLVFF